MKEMLEYVNLVKPAGFMETLFWAVAVEIQSRLVALLA